MALRNQPYIPLYVQDYLTDEKLSMCSWESQGIYIKIMCILHKQKEYGCLLFKQNSKQNFKLCLGFAKVLIKLIPCELEKMEAAILDLVSNEVLFVNDEKLYQPRMVRDGEISIKRSKVAKDGGGNPNLFKQNSKQNTENEIENVINHIDTLLSIDIARDEKIKSLLSEIDRIKNIHSELNEKYSNELDQKEKLKIKKLIDRVSIYQRKAISHISLLKA